MHKIQTIKNKIFLYSSTQMRLRHDGKAVCMMPNEQTEWIVLFSILIKMLPSENKLLEHFHEKRSGRVITLCTKKT